MEAIEQTPNESLLAKRFMACVTERDIDLILLEELSVSNSFRQWFADSAYGGGAYQDAIGTWHSLVDASLGESDIVFVFSTTTGRRAALLIENKIDAAAQEDQGGRYQLRGIKGVSHGHWDEFKTCIVAPTRYLGSPKHSQPYDVAVTYEQLRAHFLSQEAEIARYTYKAYVLQEAVEQNRRGYQPDIHLAMTTFALDYHVMATQGFPELAMQAARPRPGSSTWIRFLPPPLPRDVYLYHQLSAGAVKLFFSAPWTLEAVQMQFGSYISSTMSIKQSGKSIAIILPVPKIDPLNLSLSQQHESAHISLEGVTALLDILKQAARTSGESP